MKHLVKSLALAVAGLALTVSVAVAQTAPKPSGRRLLRPSPA